ncbi:MAG: 2-amino-4-hydroxy-6-hydroxymethyldihydropteridine diphosphokinase [Candidatus Marinimicrobia bacterium]|nr:2-amino-4-hydroxy-6-hydroxymethyldihydropteridine diphosphokinase [Candidatus Neomarinimicrobiota bacterium]
MNQSCVFLSLGSNLDVREAHLASALNASAANPKITIRRESSVYKTAPKYNPNQPDFLNMVVEIATSMTPQQLLDFCKKTEIHLGRHPSTLKNSPREIDIDIIFFDRLIFESAGLTIPHPGLYERKFVLAPLAEIAPDFICPKTGKSALELLNSCLDSDRVTRIGRLADLKTDSDSHGVL